MSIRFKLILICTLLLAMAEPYKVSATAITCAETYTVQTNDWLSKISEKYYGSIKSYPALVAATNRLHKIDSSFSLITNLDQIAVGWKLCVPPEPEARALLLLEPDPLSLNKPPVVSSIPYTLDDFIAEFEFGPDVDPEWIRSTPQPVKKFKVSSQHQVTQDAYGERANYLWNEYLSNDYFIGSGLFDAMPAQIKTYRAPWQTAMPRYRYPSNVTLPTGLTTNQYGWRGSQIALKKPDNTIRIAAVGASTTVGGHPYPHSYPQYLQHWLNLWSRKNGYNINFEVINAGREGIGSSDIATIVHYEILPMDVDYVIYYEGSNQFTPQRIVNFPDNFVFGQPPAGTAPQFSNVDSEDKSVLDQLSEYSAIAARARTIVEQFALSGQEPPKPEQTLNLPDGVDELRPDPERLGRALNMKRITQDLDQIKEVLDANNARFVMTTFNWFVYDKMVLDPARHRNLYGYLNRVYWPISYANMRRLADLQNRVYRLWAADHGVHLIDVAGQMPKEPDLYADAIHNSVTGTKIRAWLNFEGLVPLLKRDIENGVLPKSGTMDYTRHPYIKPLYQTRQLASVTTTESQ